MSTLPSFTCKYGILIIAGTPSPHPGQGAFCSKRPLEPRAAHPIGAYIKIHFGEAIELARQKKRLAQTAMAKALRNGFLCADDVGEKGTLNSFVFFVTLLCDDAV